MENYALKCIKTLQNISKSTALQNLVYVLEYTSWIASFPSYKNQSYSWKTIKSLTATLLEVS